MILNQDLMRIQMKSRIVNKSLYGYIFNRNNMTEDDKMVAMRRTITSENTFPYVIELGNDYCIQFWYGDVTNWPGYAEYDELY